VQVDGVDRRSEPKARAARLTTSSSMRVAALLTVANGFVDAYTFLAHGGVFANAQTGNVVLFGVGLARPGVASPLAHLWPILAFVAGLAAARALKTPSAKAVLRYPRRFSLLVQITVLIVVGSLSQSTPQWVITTTIGFVSALQLSLFRTVRSATFVTVAMTGNLMRATEALHDAVRGGRRERHRAALYATLIVGFGGGAVVGALITVHLDTRAAWVPAGIIALALAQYTLDDLRRPRATAPPALPAH
jgi:uncharacterized membrane protein YoaK (UPF0700 family)